MGSNNSRPLARVRRALIVVAVVAVGGVGALATAHADPGTPSSSTSPPSPSGADSASSPSSSQAPPTSSPSTAAPSSTNTESSEPANPENPSPSPDGSTLPAPTDVGGAQTDDGELTPPALAKMAEQQAIAPPEAATSMTVPTASAVACWGDSLSYHLCGPRDGASTSYLAAAMPPGTTVLNRGVGGESSTEVAIRQGAIPLILSVEGGVIPESGSVTVTVDSPGGVFNVTKIWGTINGVPGLLERAWRIVDHWTFTRTDAGVVTPVSDGTRLEVPQGDDGIRDLPALFWVGRNNPTSTAIVLRDIAAMVANRDQSSPYLVIGVTPGPYEFVGSPGYKALQDLNTQLQKTYGNNYVDLTAYLADRALFDLGMLPTAADSSAIAKRTNPPSLTIADNLHFNDAGNRAIAGYLTRILAHPDDLGIRSLDPKGDAVAYADAEGTITVVGWAFDPSNHYAAAQVTVTDGTIQPRVLSASLPTPYLWDYGVPGGHGFVTSYRAASTGVHDVCVTVTNISYGSTQQINCIAVSVTSLAANNDPQGDVVVLPDSSGIVTVVGWAFDHTNPAASIGVQVRLNGRAVTTGVASLPTPYLYPYGVPGGHGYVGAIEGQNGTNEICLVGLNFGPGSDQVVGCRTIEMSIPPKDPIGAINVGMTAGGQITVEGWATDLSAPYSAVILGIYANNSPVIFTYASGARPELAQFGIPGNHGINTSFNPPVNPGANEICVYAFNIGPGSNTALACNVVNSGNYNPLGAQQSQLDKAGKINVDGWAIDFSVPDAPTIVTVYRNGVLAGSMVANEARFELNWMFGWPYYHGFQLTIPALSGENNVCVYAMNLGQGSTTPLGCDQVTT